MEDFFDYDEEQVVDNQDAQDGTQTEPTEMLQHTEQINEPTNEPLHEDVSNDKIHIEGLGEFTVDEIKEFKQGYLRQQDYTKKTQEIAKQREALTGGQQQEQQTPVHPFEQRVMELEQKLADKELDDTITNLKTKYPDFDEVKVLNLAYEKGITDLEMVYKSTIEVRPTDIDSMKAQIRAEIMKEIQTNATATGTIISSGNPAVQNNSVQLTQQEKVIAEEWGMTPEEYLEYK